MLTSGTREQDMHKINTFLVAKNRLAKNAKLIINLQYSQLKVWDQFHVSIIFYKMELRMKNYRGMKTCNKIYDSFEFMLKFRVDFVKYDIKKSKI